MHQPVPVKRRSRRFIDLTNLKFGRLTVVCESHRRGYETYWLCRCECGGEKRVSGVHLRVGKTQSCGCIVHDMLLKRNTTHGKCKSKENRAWSAMKTRCTNPKSQDYPNYGGRGIRVCERWLNSFEAFLEDMGEAPSDKHTVDRIDHDGPYSPENCRWATETEQQNNKRSNVVVEYRGVTYPSLAAFCRALGVNRDLLKYYRTVLKLPLEECVRRTRIGQGTGGSSDNRRKHPKTR